MRFLRTLAVVWFMVEATSARAAPPEVLRFGTLVPDGTAWAHEVKALSRAVEVGSGGTLGLRWYFGGIAGDEFAMLERIRKGQLDGMAGGVSCMRSSPTMRATHLPGIFYNRDEMRYVMAKLKPAIDDELLHAGLINLAQMVLGPAVILSRTPVDSMAALKRLRAWRWNMDEFGIVTYGELRLNTLPLPLEEAGRAFEDGRVDGFFVVPAAALAFQFSAKGQFFTNLKIDYVPACLVVAARAYDRLGLSERRVLVEASAVAGARFDEVSRQQDEALLGGLFARQGLKPVKVSSTFLTEFRAEARLLRQRVGDQILPRGLIDHVQALLADYREESAGPRRRH